MLLIGKLLEDCYPDAKRKDGYLGAVASILITYPRSVAMACCDATGVATTTTYPPTIAHVVAWCESRTAELNGRFYEAKHREEQIKERMEEQSGDPVMRARVAEKFKALSESLKGKMAAVYREEKKAQLEKVAHADRVIIDRDFRDAGIKETVLATEKLSEMHGEVASPALRKIIQSRGEQS